MRVDPNYVAGLVGSLERTTATEQSLTQELSSGQRVTALSDDPVAAAANARLEAGIGVEDTFVQTAATTESRLQVMDSAFGQIVSQLTQAVSLAVQGKNGALSGSNLQAVVTQLTGIRDQVVSLANTSYQGSYVFAGSATGTQPFAVDASGNVTYSGDAVTQSVVTPTGQAIQTNVVGSAVFQAPGADVMAALNSLITAFSSGNAAGADVGALTAALGNVSQQRATVGTSLSSLQAGSTYASTQMAQMQAAQTTLMSASTASVATQLSQAETQQTALMNVMGTLEKGSLFDYTH